MLGAEAKQKYCPFKLSGSVLQYGIGEHYCEGSNCMAWEWFAPTFRQIKDAPKYFQNEIGQVVASVPSGYEECFEKMPPQGDCGMKPKDLYCNGGY